MDTKRSYIGGWLAVAFILSVLVTLLSGHTIGTLHTFLVLGVIAILPTRLPQSLKWQCGVMQVLGWACFIWAEYQLGSNALPWYAPIIANIPLLTLFAAVSFLRVVAPKADPDEKNPRGIRAFWQTLLGTHLLAAVINMSAGFVVADRLQRDEGLERTLGNITMRSIAIAAYWSPFFGAMATVLHYLGDIPLWDLWVLSLPLATIALITTWWEANHHSDDQLQTFRGYPLTFEALILPLSLFISVLAARAIWDDIPMVTLVSCASLIVPIIILLARSSIKSSAQQLNKHVTQGLNNLRGEFLLFMSAGVLGTGGAVLLKLYPPLLPFETFTPIIACGLLVLIIGIAMLGIHTLVGISVTAPIILNLNPDLTLLALCYLSAWSIAAIISPFSGLALAFRGRYQLSLSTLLQRNQLYAFVMTLSSMLAFFLI